MQILHIKIIIILQIDQMPILPHEIIELVVMNIENLETYIACMSTNSKYYDLLNERLPKLSYRFLGLPLFPKSSEYFKKYLDNQTFGLLHKCTRFLTETQLENDRRIFFEIYSQVYNIGSQFDFEGH